MGLMLRAATSGGFGTLTSDAASFVLTPLQRLSTGISNAATDFFASFTSYRAVKSENEKLKKQVQQLTSRVVGDDELRRENEQYKDFMGIKQEHSDYKFTPAMVIARDTTQWVSTFTVDKGSLDGIQMYEPVITPDGLAGRITTVMTTSSVVTTVLDPSIKVAALVSRTGELCIAQGDNTLVAKGQLYVSGIDRNSLVTPGDIIITSGFGGDCPKGLRVATVQNVTIDKSMSKLAVAVPLADVANIRNVFIITDFKGKTAG